MFTERIFDQHGNLLIEEPYKFCRLFRPGQEQIIRSVPMTVLSCSKCDDVITTKVFLHAPWPKACTKEV